MVLPYMLTGSQYRIGLQKTRKLSCFVNISFCHSMLLPSPVAYCAQLQSTRASSRQGRENDDLLVMMLTCK